MRCLIAAALVSADTVAHRASVLLPLLEWAITGASHLGLSAGAARELEDGSDGVNEEEDGRALRSLTTGVVPIS